MYFILGIIVLILSTGFVCSFITLDSGDWMRPILLSIAISLLLLGFILTLPCFE